MARRSYGRTCRCLTMLATRTKLDREERPDTRHWRGCWPSSTGEDERELNQGTDARCSLEPRPVEAAPWSMRLKPRSLAGEAAAPPPPHPGLPRAPAREPAPPPPQRRDIAGLPAGEAAVTPPRCGRPLLGEVTPLEDARCWCSTSPAAGSFAPPSSLPLPSI